MFTLIDTFALSWDERPLSAGPSPIFGRFRIDWDSYGLLERGPTDT